MLGRVLCEHLLHKIYCLQRQICFTNSTFKIVTLKEVVETDAHIFVLDFKPLGIACQGFLILKQSSTIVVAVFCPG